MKYIYAVYRVLLYLCSTAVLLIAIPFLIAIAFLFGKRPANVFPRYYAKLLSFCVPMRIEVEGKENIIKDQSYVVVMNHRSLMDIVAVYASLDIDLRWVMKEELTRVPVFGPASVLLGNIPIDRKNTSRALASINKAKKEISSGTSVVFFPEGTRITDRTIGPFKKGAFHVALDIGVPVLPVALVGTDTILPKGTYKFAPGKIKVIILPAVDNKKYTKVRVNAFSDEAHAAISNTLNKETGSTT